ncbi:MAG: DUF1552 domain-containing protein [Deltaproteobacteria bacterium]|nr:DUF1552 domain-containing protein [Deltaproteobacteria bacterium]MBK8239041.1 DUF1552 domain-containing protein [Deltaproteobacteria bacterium]MBK8717551.1 DUF1552 domain-containing protein [Deltaproteobacteria bacterium]MBP7285841.1 DUF1552 domain-containing protein [Nannocystaceae bacterium]
MTLRMSRRTLLRGTAGIGLTLPMLEVMLPRRRARAADGLAPKRLVVWYTSTGTVLGNWRPGGSGGTQWVASPILAPLDTPTLRPQLTILSGVRMAAAEALPGNGHVKGMTSVLTARPFKDIESTQFGDVGWGADVSFDQEVAKHLGNADQLRSVETGIITFGGGATEYISYADGGGQAGVVPSEADPRKVFTRLFANIPDSDAAKAELEKVVAQRKSILDLVQDDFARINGKLGAQDQQRLDKHLTLVRELEDRIKVGAYCAKPPEPTVDDAQIHQNQMIPTLGQLQMDLVAAGLGCDATRVATLQWSGAQSVFDFRDLIPSAPWDALACPPEVDTCGSGLNTAQHTISHISVGTAGGIPQGLSTAQQTAMECLSAISTFYSQQLAYFGDALANSLDVDGSPVLDNTVIVCVTEVAEGPTHAYTDMPLLLLGTAGGALRPGHYDFGNERTMNDLFVTVGQALGIDGFDSFGAPEYVNGPLTELLT